MAYIKTLLIALALSFIGAVPANAGGDGAPDKIAHFALSAGMTYGAMELLDINPLDPDDGWKAFLVGAGVFSLGMAKEYYDYRYGPTNTWDREDLMVDGVGIFFGFIIVFGERSGFDKHSDFNE